MQPKRKLIMTGHIMPEPKRRALLASRNARDAAYRAERSVPHSGIAADAYQHAQESGRWCDRVNVDCAYGRDATEALRRCEAASKRAEMLADTAEQNARNMADTMARMRGQMDDAVAESDAQLAVGFARIDARLDGAP